MAIKTFKIQKFTDRQLAIALGNIGAAISKFRTSRVVANFEYFGGIEISSDKPADTPAAQFTFEIDASLSETMQLLDKPSGCLYIRVNRKPDEHFDLVDLSSEIYNYLDRDQQNSIYRSLVATLNSSFLKELRVVEFSSSMSDQTDTEWARYRSAQLEILGSLQKTSERVLVDAEQHIAKAKQKQDAEYQKLQEDLRSKFDSEKEELLRSHEARTKDLDAREEDLKKKLSDYETHEALYVARKKAEEQLTQLKAWLADSSLTAETVAKRRPVFLAYCAAMLISIGFAAWYSFQGYEVVSALGKDVIQMPWWQWAAITLKAVMPIAAFTTFAIYFMRWEGAWARQHAEEELRTRARIIDIGRSTWLLEAVRDSGDNIKPALLAELSKNLFSDAHSSDSGDHHPTSLTDFVEKLSAIKVKTPDGTEFEASRSKK